MMDVLSFRFETFIGIRFSINWSAPATKRTFPRFCKHSARVRVEVIYAVLSAGLRLRVKFHSRLIIFPILTRVTPSLSLSSIIVRIFSSLLRLFYYFNKTSKFIYGKLNLSFNLILLLFFTLHSLRARSRERNTHSISTRKEINRAERIIGLIRSTKIPLKIEKRDLSVLSTWLPFPLCASKILLQHVLWLPWDFRVHGKLISSRVNFFFYI